MASKMLLEHAISLGEFRGNPVEASILEGSTVALVCRGATKILVPAPVEGVRDEVKQALTSLDKGERNRIQIVDERGREFRRVREFLWPLRQQATKWPETAFLDFGLHFLYKLHLGSKFNAHVADGDASTVRGFLGIVDFSVFQQERERMLELVRLVAGYVPDLSQMSAQRRDLARPGHVEGWEELLALEEFDAVVRAHGRLGLSMRPAVTLRRLNAAFQDFNNSRKGRTIVRSGAVGIEIGSAIATGGLASIDIERFIPIGRGTFTPAFEPLGEVEVSIAQQALVKAHPGAKPSGKAAYALRTLGGHSWLNKDELSKVKAPSAAAVARQKREALLLRQKIERTLVRSL
jgi:hypothetical protein